MKFDLHFHTTFSDGHKTPEEAVQIAKKNGLWFIACTDHDIINTRIPELARMYGIETLEWVELSSADYGNKNKAAHLTCYARKFQGRILSVLDNIQEAKTSKVLQQIEKLQKGGFLIEEEAFLEYWTKLGSNIANLNNGNIKEYLFKNPLNEAIAREKIGETYEQATFVRQALSRTGDFAHIGSVDNLPEYEPSVEICGELAKENDAVLSIAHPNYSFKSIEEFQNLVPSYVERGVNALEIHYSTPPDWIQTILETRNRFNLLLTFWSDCHFNPKRDGKHGTLGELNSHMDPTFIENEFRKFREAL